MNKKFVECKTFKNNKFKNRKLRPQTHFYDDLALCML
jgi:hypothetical protein